MHRWRTLWRRGNFFANMGCKFRTLVAPASRRPLVGGAHGAVKIGGRRGRDAHATTGGTPALQDKSFNCGEHGGVRGETRSNTFAYAVMYPNGASAAGTKRVRILPGFALIANVRSQKRRTPEAHEVGEHL
jgi:hypothetical protein